MGFPRRQADDREYPQHVFTSVGTFPVVLTVTDDLGQQSQTTLAVVVTAPAVVNPTPVLAGAGKSARGRH